MKKSHLILLIVTAVMALSSAYSLAAINQVYKIDFEWYSQYNKEFSSELRETARDKWLLQVYPQFMQFFIAPDRISLLQHDKKFGAGVGSISNTDFQKYLILYCTLGQVYSPEYRIKITNVAQRGNTVEIRVSTNSPDRISEDTSVEGFFPYDIIRINKSGFPGKGKLYFVLKNQYGIQLYQQYMYVK